MIKKIIESFKCAFCGVYDYILLGRNAKIQVIGAFLIIIAGVVMYFDISEWIAVVICIGLVLSLEAINTDIEELSDAITEKKNERI